MTPDQVCAELGIESGEQGVSLAEQAERMAARRAGILSMICHRWAMTPPDLARLPAGTLARYYGEVTGRAAPAEPQLAAAAKAYAANRKE